MTYNVRDDVRGRARGSALPNAIKHSPFVIGFGVNPSKSWRYPGKAIVRHRIEQQKMDQRPEFLMVSKTPSGKPRLLDHVRATIRGSITAAGPWKPFSCFPESAVLLRELRDGLCERLNLAFLENRKVFEIRQVGRDVQNLQPAVFDVARKMFARQVAHPESGHRQRGQYRG